MTKPYLEITANILPSMVGDTLLNYGLLFLRI